MFTTWGRFVYRRRWLVLIASLVVLVASIAVLAQGGTLGKANGGKTESDRAALLIDAQLPKNPGFSVTLVFGCRAAAAFEMYRPEIEDRLAMFSLLPLRIHVHDP